ncbi:3'(2'),5'-bisphosphate nucleotidase CysQ [Sphingorhabdus sp. EL138]|uniref:3'(2'),5'-bisphosphate nucleotidase CysQ n=1 Tax=Sphingorhabdus sp. EL138 TaxID=2073156 RepID=UPI00265CAE1F|nr:3'(2'),5'-bisphosphate nucleotidase CysQ [Sphingorhabdus sp. EL138]
MVDFDEIIAIAREAGDLAMLQWQAGKSADKTWEKSPGQIVSEADIAVDRFLRERLEAQLPEAGWLSEETAEDQSLSGRDMAWVVDPIDGTKDFVKGKPGWCVSVALVQNGAPIFGVLNAPAMDEIWTAKAGSHTEVNGKLLKASQCSNYNGARLPVEELPDHIDLTPVFKPNSIALRLAMVADDRADLVVSTRWGSEWDIAAAHVIAEEAGAIVTDAHGKELRYNGTHGQAFGVLCTSQGIHDAAVARVAKFLSENEGQS